MQRPETRWTIHITGDDSTDDDVAMTSRYFDNVMTLSDVTQATVVMAGANVVTTSCTLFCVWQSKIGYLPTVKSLPY